MIDIFICSIDISKSILYIKKTVDVNRVKSTRRTRRQVEGNREFGLTVMRTYGSN